MDLYQKQIIDHYKTPRNFGRIKDKSVSSHSENPSCGDSISMDVLFRNGKVEDIMFEGEGCVIAIAAASMLTEKIKGKRVGEVADLNFADIQKMLGVKVNPSRKNCAMLALNTLKKMVLKYLRKEDAK